MCLCWSRGEKRDEFCSLPKMICSFSSEMTNIPLRKLTHIAWVNSHQLWCLGDLNHAAWVNSCYVS